MRGQRPVLAVPPEAAPEFCGRRVERIEPNWWWLRDTVATNTIYRGCMGKLFLIVLAVIAAFMVLSAVISALHFIFWVAVVALIVVVGLRLTGGARRWSRR